MHFINGGDTAVEFQVIRLRDERRFANRRVDARETFAAVLGDGVLHGRVSRARACWIRLQVVEPHTNAV